MPSYPICINCRFFRNLGASHNRCEKYIDSVTQQLGSCEQLRSDPDQCGRSGRGFEKKVGISLAGSS
jgi:hypothetical protein